jgi:hypothetical protein
MVLAHGGGLPEAATVLVPLLVVAAFVVQERRNVRRLRDQEERAGGCGPRKDAED